MTLRKWIAMRGGPRKLSKVLKLNPLTIWAWLRCDSTPRPRVMVDIVRRSRGKVSYETIVLETLKGRKK